MGALLAEAGVSFRVWAPAAVRVDVALHQSGEAAHFVPMQANEDGTWTATVAEAGVGTRYKFRLNGTDAFPDPYSRSQPDGVHGPSEVIALDAPPSTDWRGVGIRGAVIYECHIGTATPEGTFDAFVGQLDRLRDLGITAIEIMPVAEFSGTRNWGYDGVHLFAVARCYGGAAGLRRLVDAAHQRGLGVLLDVVYNHFGPEGNYLREFSPLYFTDRHQTPWGQAINYDGEGSAWVRKLVLDNALSWIHEYQIDGLRLDAVHEIKDDSEVHLLQELTTAVRRALTAEGREGILIAETDENDPRYLRPVEEGGFGLDAVWADDFHHSMRRYLAGDHEGYYADYVGTLAEVGRAFQQGWLFEGQWSSSLGRERGAPAREQPAWQFVWTLQNHDQIGNRPMGDRLHHGQVDLDRYRAAAAVLLLAPYTPLLFMGQEFAASSPFQYFTDHSSDLGRLVTEGRRKEFRGFSGFSSPSAQEAIPDPQADETFLRSKLKLEEAQREPGAQIQLLFQVLIRLRRADPVFQRQDRQTMHTQALTPEVLAVHRWLDGEHRLLLANFGAEEETVDLIAALGRQRSPITWSVVLDTAERRFGGPGASAAVEPEQGLVAVPPRTAVVLTGRVGGAASSNGPTDHRPLTTAPW